MATSREGACARSMAQASALTASGERATTAASGPMIISALSRQRCSPVSAASRSSAEASTDWPAGMGLSSMVRGRTSSGSRVGRGVIHDAAVLEAPQRVVDEVARGGEVGAVAARLVEGDERVGEEGGVLEEAGDLGDAVLPGAQHHAVAGAARPSRKSAQRLAASR